MIADDLAKLKDLDHATWFNLREQGIFGLLDSDIAFERNRALDIIQGTIQRSIDSIKGWDWAISSWHRDGIQTYVAYVNCHFIEYASDSAESPADAILGAYVAAKEA